MEPMFKVSIEKKEMYEKDVNLKQMVKHLLPGNHLVDEKEEAKVGARQNRYGTNGDNGYGQIVEIKKKKYE